MYEDLQGLAEYFGEPYKPADPARPVCVMRDFVLLFEKVLREIKVRCCLLFWRGRGASLGC